MEANFSIGSDGLEEQRQESMGEVILHIFLIVMQVVTCVLGILGNGLVIWVAGFRMTRTVTTLCYLNLAFADFFFTLMMPFYIVTMVMRDQWLFGQFLCKIISIVGEVNIFGSIFLIAFIAVDRCVCVLHPIWTQNHRTVGLATKVLVVPWALAFLLSLPVLLYMSAVNDKQGHVYCTFIFSSLEEIYSVLKIHTIVRFLVAFILPMSSVAICYGLIAAKIHHKGSIKFSRTLRLLTTVVASFFLCWFPFQLVTLLVAVWFKEMLEGKHEALVYLVGPTKCLAWFNSCLNPLLYVFMGRDFRQKLIHSLPAILERALSEDAIQSEFSVKSTLDPEETEFQAI